MSGGIRRDELLCLIDRGPEWMDEQFTLRGCTDQVLSLRPQAAQIGLQCAQRVWDKRQSTADNLARLGIAQVRWMSPMEELAYQARAIYDPQSAQILVHRSHLEEMAEVQRALGLELFPQEKLLERLLAHECFHHIEETRDMRLNEHLRIVVELPAALRDVGAHAFSNGIFGLPPCQAVDLLWLAAHKPDVISSF